MNTLENPRSHILGTYNSLRLALCLLGFLLPLVLMIGGKLQSKIPAPTHSMSAYYHLTGPPAVVQGQNDYSVDHEGNAQVAGLGTMRNWFVGMLFAVGILLFAYEGYSSKENIALNIAGLCAWGVAVAPMKWPPANDPGFSFSLHWVFAATLFLMVAYVCIARARDTLTPGVTPLPPELRTKYVLIYKWLGLAMFCFPVIAWVLNSIIGNINTFTFWLEATGIWIFSAYWGVKTWELKDGKLDESIARGEVEHSGAVPMFRPSQLRRRDRPEAATALPQK